MLTLLAVSGREGGIMSVFKPADILIPKVESMEKWSVIACDQFSSQPEYWESVRAQIGDAPSTINLILPEAELGSVQEEKHIESIHTAMKRYLDEHIFAKYPEAFVYTERTLENGCIRRGVVGAVDLEAYDYEEGAKPVVRATEKTVVERIPPRMRIRRNAVIELPHVLLLCDDEKKNLIESVSLKKEELTKLYEFELMKDGGHIAGWLIQGEVKEEFERRLEEYEEWSRKRYISTGEAPMLYAVGDGNHSLATAKACYDELKRLYLGEDAMAHPARYALVELENIHDDALRFAPIYRIITGTDPWELLETLKNACGAENGYPVTWYIGDESGTIYLDRSKSRLAVAVLQPFLDEYLTDHAGEIDYIHGSGVLKDLAGQEDAIGFVLPVMEKSSLFDSVVGDGVLPRKTFSMGHAGEKRYYLEARKIVR